MSGIARGRDAAFDATRVRYEDGPVPLLDVTPQGLFCAAGGFHVDPLRPVDRALITHAHADHARPGSNHYLCAQPGLGVLRQRLGRQASIESLPYGEPRLIDGVTVSFHPSGHVIGAAQIRIEHRGEVWVVSGDYKLQPDPTCAPFEPVRCHTFITESTFGLPVYSWPEPAAAIADLHAWWRRNRAEQRLSVVLAYSLGKSQRVLAQLDPGEGPILLHAAADALAECYRAEGVVFPPYEIATPERLRAARATGLWITPADPEESKLGSAIGDWSTAVASGWMAVRGARRWRAADRGLVISDHADWRGLNAAIDATGATRVLVTHGFTKPFVRWLRGRGLDAQELGIERREEGMEDS